MERIEYVDITERLLESQKQMKEGQFIISENFTLYDAMNATEVMDPKIDSKHGIDQTFEATREKIKKLNETIPKLTQEQLILVLDELYSRSAAWLNGLSMHAYLLSYL